MPPVRKIYLNGIDKELNITKATQVNISKDKDFIYLDKLPDGNWRLVYTSNIIEDFSKIKSFDIIREN